MGKEKVLQSAAECGIMTDMATENSPNTSETPAFDDVSTLLPHRAPMVLIDRVTAFDAAERTVTAEVTISPNQVFFDGTGVPAYVAIEYLAQTAGALVGLYDRAAGRAPRPGLLLGTRRLDLACAHFPAGATYRLTATCSFEGDAMAAFACAMTDAAGARVATAELTAYRPPDIATFLQEQCA